MNRRRTLEHAEVLLQGHIAHAGGELGVENTLYGIRRLPETPGTEAEKKDADIEKMNTLLSTAAHQIVLVGLQKLQSEVLQDTTRAISSETMLTAGLVGILQECHGHDDSGVCAVSVDSPARQLLDSAKVEADAYLKSPHPIID